MSTFVEIYTALEKLGQPSRLPGPWKALPPRESPFFCLPMPAEQVVQHMREQFSDQDLAAAGVLRTVAKVWKLNPSLRSDHLVRVDARPGSANAQLVAGNQVLPKPQPPYQALLRDGRWRSLLADGTDRLAVVNNLAEAAVLWQVKIPAVPLTSLAPFDAPKLARLRLLLRGGCPSTLAPFQEALPPLMLVGFFLAALQPDMPPEMQDLNNHFKSLQEHLDLDLQTFSWQPSAIALEGFAAAITFGDWAILKQQVRLSMQRDAVRFGLHEIYADAGLGRPMPVDSYAAALHQWIESRSMDLDTRQQAQATLNTHCERELVTTLLHSARQTNDPIEANLLASLAHICRELHSLAAKRAIERAPQDLISPRKAARSEAEDKEFYALLRQQMQLCSAIVNQRRAAANGTAAGIRSKREGLSDARCSLENSAFVDQRVP